MASQPMVIMVRLQVYTSHGDQVRLGKVTNEAPLLLRIVFLIFISPRMYMHEIGDVGLAS